MSACVRLSFVLCARVVFVAFFFCWCVDDVIVSVCDWRCLCVCVVPDLCFGGSVCSSVFMCGRTVLVCECVYVCVHVVVPVQCCVAAVRYSFVVARLLLL